MQRLDTKHRTELKRVGKVRSHWGPRDLFWHLITEEEEGGCNQGEESTEKVLASPKWAWQQNLVSHF